MSRARRTLRLLARGALAALGLMVVASAYVELRYARRIRSLEELPQTPVALVFGAGLSRPGSPSPVLAERLDAAVLLYRLGKVQRVLLSGNSSRYHDETGAMRRYAIANGVPESALLEDPQGVTTHDSCARARQIYGVERAVLVTQHFHLPRALFIANSLGIDAYGLASDAERERWARYPIRELLARPLALARVWVGAANER